MDRVRVAGGRADRAGRRTMSPDGCGAPAGGASAPAATGSQAVVEGRVVHEGSPVATGYARLLGTGDGFVAEVPLGEDGGFRFFAAPGHLGRAYSWAAG